ncbi:hypothetical protein NGRA_0660 [Nosema granulosis]|uniref:Uncharacterized protein n=1 Tax=Nosema granulosis TaxID=83296 RepID=A0A9P6GZX0_9MICR|nr:hypothetical protein NGRA_0660 [Nosema granulosis]
MIIFENISQFLLNKNTKAESDTANPPMIMFYSMTLNGINKFLRAITESKENSMHLLREYLNIIEDPKMTAIKAKDLLNYRLNFIEDLRIAIISMLRTPDKKERYILKQYHSILHLVSLKLKRKTSPYQIINEWLNTNTYLDDSQIKLHAMRGNFGKIVKTFPQSRDAIEELCIFENHIREGKISEREYDIIKNKWRNKYESVLPEEVKDILTGDYEPFDEHWTEKICYYLAYSNNCAPFEDVLNRVVDIDNEDILVNILKGDSEKLLMKSNGWLNLVLQFFYMPISRKDVFDIFNLIGERLIGIDWQLALDYFSFTVFSLYHFDNLCTSIDMNPVVFDFLFRYARKNNLDTSNLFRIYSNHLLENESYFLLLEFMTTCGFYDVKFSCEFVEFIIVNYDDVKKHFNDCFSSLPALKYVRCFIRLFKEQIEPNKEELEIVFNNSYTLYLFRIVFELTTKAKTHCARTISKCMDFLYEKEKDLTLGSSELNLYKSEFLNFLCILNSKQR